jgi:hypothetical protein
MNQFDIPETRKQLKKINKANGITLHTAIDLIVNNMQLYNDVLEKVCGGEEKYIWMLYPLNSTIFKQLKEFGIMPSSKKINDVQEETGLNSILKILPKTETR